MNLKKILSEKIGKEYWLAKEETECFEQGGLPIFTPNDVAELKAYEPSKDELLKVWVGKSLQKVSVGSIIMDLRQEPKEKHQDQYQKPRKNEMMINYTTNIINSLKKIPNA